MLKIWGVKTHSSIVKYRSVDTSGSSSFPTICVSLISQLICQFSWISEGISVENRIALPLLLLSCQMRMVMKKLLMVKTFSIRARTQVINTHIWRILDAIKPACFTILMLDISCNNTWTSSSSNASWKPIQT